MVNNFIFSLLTASYLLNMLFGDNNHHLRMDNVNNYIFILVMYFHKITYLLVLFVITAKAIGKLQYFVVMLKLRGLSVLTTTYSNSLSV